MDAEPGNILYYEPCICGIEKNITGGKMYEFNLRNRLL